MKLYNRFFLGLTCLVLLSFTFAKGEALAAPCDPLPSVKIEGDSYTSTSIQDAYNYASAPAPPPSGLGLSSFTLQLAAGIFYEDLTLDGGTVVLDGGYDCSFTTKSSTSSVLGKLTIASGSLNVTADTAGFTVVSTDQCDFDTDLDGFTRIGSCAGTADDCDDTNPATNPDAIEICDGIDNNCNGQIDEGAVGIDADGDGYFAIGSCGTGGDDCNDSNPNINPGAVEIAYDGIDQDCNGSDLIFAEDFLPLGENCGRCHGVDRTQWDVVHDAVTAPDTTCAACHNAYVSNIVSAHYGQTVRTAGNNMTAGETIVCNSCHDQISDVHNFGDNFVMAKVFAAWNSFTPITCNTCHENQAEYHQSAHDNRVITAICADCHTSDTSVIGQPGTGTLETQADVDTLHRSDCALCHGYNGTKLNPAIVAQAIQAGINGTPIDCLECHTDFGTIHAFLDNHNNLVQVGTTSCSNCHSDPPPLTSLTDPKAHSSCFNCHDADYNTISLAENKTFAAGGDCTTCHGFDWQALHLNDPPDHSALVQVASTGCFNCHDNTLFSAAANTHDGCFNCHDPATGDLVTTYDTNLQTFSPGGDCTTCHTDPFDAVHPADIDHSALIKGETTGCADCHDDPPPLVDVDPINADDPKLHDACSSCHDVEGGLISLAADKSFDQPGNCITCHTASFETFHPLDIDHSAIVNVGITSCGTGSCHSDPPPLIDPIDPKVHNACLSCHNDEGRLIEEAAGKTFAAGDNCTTCHTGTFDTVHPEDVDHSQAIQLSTDCNGCHTGPPPVIDSTDPTVHDFCISCHDAQGGLISIAAGNPAPNECITCHGNDLTALHPNSTANHNATPGSDHVLIFAAGNHDSAMIGDGTVDIACSNCHNTDLGNIHDNNCAACHSGDPSPYDTLNNNWQGGCSQGGCHTTYHADSTASHLTVEDQCTQCHGETFSDFPPLPSSCANCHASYNPSDTSPPTTTSDVQPTYLEPARINYSMTDNGKIGIGTIYTKVDGGPKQAGSSIRIYEIGTHTIEFWGVDQAGNEEQPHNFATFEILADTTPPVTTSDAATNYYYNANITLTATDDNTASGVKATYYTLNGGPVETYEPGTPIFVAKQPVTASYTLQFWSEDWFGNVETTKTQNFTVHGYSTLRLVWGNSDNDGSPCGGEPGAAVTWTIRSGTIIVSSGTDGCPDWSGVNDIAVSSGRAYYVRLDWYVDGGTNFEDVVIYESVDVPTAGEVIRLPY